MIPFDSAMFHRRGDSSNEYIEIILYQDGQLFEVWEAVGFLKDPDHSQRCRIALGSESEMRARFDAELIRLQNEGLTKAETS
jgi:hypothetical protein